MDRSADRPTVFLSPTKEDVMETPLPAPSRSAPSQTKIAVLSGAVIALLVIAATVARFDPLPTEPAARPVAQLPAASRTVTYLFVPTDADAAFLIRYLRIENEERAATGQPPLDLRPI